MTTRNAPDKEWLRSLPHARPQLPGHPIDFAKYIMWRIITPLHPAVRDLLAYMRLLRNEGRQNYLLGKLAPGQTIESFVEFLLQKGFGNHFIAFTDEGQVVSLRYVEDFRYQYHVRVFNDGEVRGHFEYTPEYKPLLHLREVGMEDRSQEFLELFGDRIVPSPYSNGKGFSVSFLGRRAI